MSAYQHENRQQSGITSNPKVLEKPILKRKKKEIYLQDKTLKLVRFSLLIFGSDTVCLFSWRIVPNNLVATQEQSGADVEILIKIACPRMLLEILALPKKVLLIKKEIIKVLLNRENLPAMHFELLTYVFCFSPLPLKKIQFPTDGKISVKNLNYLYFLTSPPSHSIKLEN